MRKRETILPVIRETSEKRTRDTSAGLTFEGEKNLHDILSKNYQLVTRPNEAGESIIQNKKVIGRLFKQREFSAWLAEFRVDTNTVWSKTLIPDTVIFNPTLRTVYIVEMKTQSTEGSADEKLQTCVFKRLQFLKLFRALNYRVEYVYLLGDWFKQPKYKDALNYIYENGCSYHFDSIPVWWFGFSA